MELWLLFPISFAQLCGFLNPTAVGEFRWAVRITLPNGGVRTFTGCVRPERVEFHGKGVEPLICETPPSLLFSCGV